MANADLAPALLEKLQVLKKITFENNVEFMYVDLKEKITVGVGHNLSDSDRTTFFQSRKFTVVRTERAVGRLNSASQSQVKGISVPAANRKGLPATAEEIQADFDYLSRLPGLHKQSPTGADTREKMRLQTTVELDATEIDAVFNEDLKSVKHDAQAIFTDFDTYPIPCQAAIIDLVYRFGKAGFRHNKAELIQAIKGEGTYKGKSASERWVGAAKLSSVTSSNEERNSTVSGWFMDGSTKVTP